VSARRPPYRDGFLLHLQAACEIVICALFFVTFIAQPFRIPSESMMPALQVGDFLLGSKQAFAPSGVLDHVLPPTTVHRGDIVIFHFPVDPTRDLVKRVVGLPGDRIHLHDGQVFLNGAASREPYAFYGYSYPDTFRDDFPSLHRMDPNTDPDWWAELRRSVVDHEVVVPAGEYFVMGDNRNNSEDSRYWGYVPRGAIVARPLVVYFSTAMPDREPFGLSFVRRVTFELHEELRNLRVVR
jgi:signal peptidase I